MGAVVSAALWEELAVDSSAHFARQYARTWAGYLALLDSNLHHMLEVLR